MNVTTKPNVGTQLNTPALAAAWQPTTKPATLVSLLGTNNGPAQFIQFWDATGTGDVSALLLYSFPVGAGLPFSLDTPVAFGRGVLIVNSSALISTTPTQHAGSADCWFLSRHI